jgi:hypothetical protein
MTSIFEDGDNNFKEFGRPRHIDFTEENEFLWPAWKFDMKAEEFYLGLHDQYNTLRIPIQSQPAFHLDVNELSTIASTRDEFHSLMVQRSQERFEEIREAIRTISLSLVMSPSQFPNISLYMLCMQLVRSKSAADLAGFLAGFQKPGRAVENRLATTAAAAMPPTVKSSTTPPSAPSVVSDLPRLSHSTLVPDFDPPALPQKSSRKPPSARRRQATDDIGRYNLRPRASCTSRRKELIRKTSKRKKP